MSNIPKILFNTAFGEELFLRQTHYHKGVAGGYQFTTDRNDRDCVALVVFGEFNGKIRTTIPKNRRIFFMPEPPEYHYNLELLNQFGVIVGSRYVDGFEGVQIFSHPSGNWFFDYSHYDKENGVAKSADKYLSLDQFEAMPWPEKNGRVSVIASDKTGNRMYNRRVEFMQLLKDRFADRVDLYGKSVGRPVISKSDIILPYSYHIVLENSDSPCQWTEKIADAYLGYALPIFSGCDISGFFPKGNYIPIDLSSADAALKTIEYVLEADPYELARPMISEARDLILHKYNLFYTVASIVDTLAENKPAKRYDTIQKLPKKKWYRFIKKIFK